MLTLLHDHFLVVAGIVAAAVCVVFILQQRRTPQSAVAWIFFIMLVPYLAVPVFLALGVRKQGTRFPPLSFTGPQKEEMAVDAPPLAETFRRLGAPPAVRGNVVRLNATPQEAQAALEEVIASAHHSLDICLYIVDRDDSGRRFLHLLADKAREGVHVRLVLDRLGSLFPPRKALAAYREAGGELRWFSPFLHPPDNGHLNLRNHRKLAIADGRRAWTGGRNVGDDYFSPGGWTDLGMRLEGPVVQHLWDVFHSDWDVTGGARATDLPDSRAPAGDAVLQLVPTGPDDPGDALHEGLVQAIHAATRRVWIATPYFVPTEHLELALVTAARRGLDVRLLVPQHSNKRVTDFARGAYLRDLDRRGARILRHPEMLHAKAGLIDGAGWVGSANFDVRSMLLNFETTLFLYDEETVSELELWFGERMAEAREGVSRPHLTRRLLENTFRLGAPFL
ncbi:phospholipase D-like domain-containing protein [Pseudoroseicyclus tamaricis]|uniref:phospholipase D-like domain-containing protein n=1 Tax=Pseudoroseicyclus tamaricis TaxID=2705421 RepID=UPI001F47B93D|nr:phospholipase D-like domain-containing protein [Pseudoroseicyclus tamaricis]